MEKKRLNNSSGMIKPNLPNVTEYNDTYDKESLDVVYSAAKMASAAALYELASRFRMGVDGATMDLAQAVMLYKEVLKYQNNRDAFYYIGYLMSEGALGDEHSSECVKYYMAACDMESSKAASQLAILYETGEFVEQDFKRAIEYYDKAIRFGNGNGTEIINKAHLYEDLGEYELARQCYFDAIQYYDKEIVKADRAELPWFFGKKGDIYRTLGDSLSAKKFYEKALSYGENSEVATKLATIYEDGIPRVLEVDNAKAYYYYVKGYETKEDGHSPDWCTFMLARFLFYEKAGAGKAYEAFKLLIEAHELGEKAANAFLGYYYGVGIPGRVDVNINLSFQLLDDVPEYYEAEALYYKGIIYLETLKNKETAMKYLEDAAAKGDVDAASLLNELSNERRILSEYYYKVADVLGEDPISEELKNATILKPAPHTVVKFAKKILNHKKLGAAFALINGGYLAFPNDSEVMDAFVCLGDMNLQYKYKSGNLSERDRNTCYLILDLIKKLRSISYRDVKGYSIAESNTYFYLGCLYKGKDNEKALNMFSKANVRYSPRTALEVYDIHLKDKDRGVYYLYIDAEMLKRAVQSDRWNDERSKAQAYYALSEIYRGTAPRITPDMEYALHNIELACKADPENSLYAKKRKKYKRNQYGKIIFVNQ